MRELWGKMSENDGASSGGGAVPSEPVKKEFKKHNFKQELRAMMKKSLDDDWPYETTIDLRKSPKPKIAFLSGVERPYFPEDPGHDRFGVAFAMSKKPTDTPQPNSYMPGRFGLSKPISKKGYGIGGLLAPRFAKDWHDKIPAPGAHQPEVSMSIEEYKTHVSGGDKNTFDYKMQGVYSFGSHLTVNRFGSEPWRPVGVGYYDLKSAGVTPKIPVNDGFRGGPAFIKPSPLTYCNYEKCDSCFECGTSLKICDYYRSRGIVRLPKGALDRKSSEEFFKSEEEEEGKGGQDPNRPGFLAICRSCYCAAMKGKHISWGWTRDYILWMFHKTRYCGYIHEHHQLPITLHKTTCSLVEKLNRKEAVMRKHYHDACERSLKQKAKAKL